jgi:hypothetical protein
LKLADDGNTAGMIHSVTVHVRSMSSIGLECLDDLILARDGQSLKVPLSEGACVPSAVVLEPIAVLAAKSQSMVALRLKR